MRFSNLYKWAMWVTASLGCHAAQANPAGAVDAGQGSAASFASAAADGASALAQRVLVRGDAGGLPFAIVDKQAATLHVYRGDGRLVGTTPALLGQTPGDRSVPGVGERTQLGQLRNSDRTTPAGRFASEPGRNRAGEAVIWIDYASAFAIHRLRPGPSREHRALRLASPNPALRRTSNGCVVVPVAFYKAVVEPVLGLGRGVVYVMPEDRVALPPWAAL
jgi:hypothetical protein